MSSFERYLAQTGLSNSTVKWYNGYVLDFIAWLDGQNADADTATAGDITAWLHALQQRGQANITRRNYLIAVRHFMAWRISAGSRNDNPASHIRLRGIKSGKLYPVFSPQELESIYHNYAVPPQTPQDKWVTGKRIHFYTISRLTRQRNKAILGLMVWQGLTTPEITALTLADLRLREGTVYVAGTRGSNERILELKPAQVMELMEYLMQTRTELAVLLDAPSDRLFIASPKAGSKVASAKGTACIWKRLCDDIKAQQPRFINFLQVRASVITHWLKTYNLRQVQYMAGHRYVSSTERYQANNLSQLQEDIDKYHPF